MFHRQKTVSTIKYSILRPSSQINLLKRSFNKPHYWCEYQVAMNDGIGIRRYKKAYDQLEIVLQDCQWRREEQSPIVRCHYVQLLPFNLTHNVVTVWQYVDDLEVTVSKMKKLLLPEAVYMISRAFEGYRNIWERYMNVSVNGETIGLDCAGNCLVWMNSSLQSCLSQECKLSSPNQIIGQVVSIIKSKCQRVSSTLIAKLLYNIDGKTSFQEGQRVLNQFIRNYKIKMPLNLKYLVNQSRLANKVEQFNNQRSIYESKESLKIFKAPHFITSRINLLEEEKCMRNFGTQRQKNNIYNTLRKTTSPGNNFLTFRSNNQERFKDSNFRQRMNEFKFAKCKFQSNSGKENKSISSHSRSRSEYFKSIQVINNIRPKTKKQIDTVRSIKEVIHSNKQSGFSDNATTAQSSTQIESMKKIFNLSYERTSKPKIQSIHNREQYQSIECSPFIIREDHLKEKCSRQSVENSDHKFQLVLEADIIRTNNWKKTVRNLLSTEAELNKSITLGQDESTHLFDVKLQILDAFNKQLVVSHIPDHLN